MRKVIIPIYSFDELTEQAKKVAYQNHMNDFCDVNLSDVPGTDIQIYLDERLAELGIQVKFYDDKLEWNHLFNGIHISNRRRFKDKGGWKVDGKDWSIGYGTVDRTEYYEPCDYAYALAEKILRELMNKDSEDRQEYEYVASCLEGNNYEFLSDGSDADLVDEEDLLVEQEQSK